MPFCTGYPSGAQAYPEAALVNFSEYEPSKRVKASDSLEQRGYDLLFKSVFRTVWRLLPNSPGQREPRGIAT